MAHYYATPSDYILPHTTTRHNIVFDGDLISGAVRLHFDYMGQLIEDPLTGPDTAAGARQFPLVPWQWGGNVVGISGNKAFITGVGASPVPAENIYSPPLSRPDIDASVTVSGPKIAGLIFRGNASLGWRVFANFVTGKVVAQLRSASLTFETPAFIGGNVTPGSSVRLRVVTKGSTISIYQDSTLLTQFTSTSYQDKGNVQLFSSTESVNTPTLGGIDTNARFSDFRIEALNPPAANTWLLRNIDGDIIAHGDVSTNLLGYIDIPDSVLRQPNGLGPYGWYHFSLHGPDRKDGKYGAAYGNCNIVRLPTRSGFAANPPRTAKNFSQAAWDSQARCVFGVGPTRLDLTVENADVVTTNAQALLDAQYLKTNYVDLAYPSRPRHIIGHFSRGTTGKEARVTQVVENFKAYVDAWEPKNEPDLDSDATTFGGTVMPAFRAAVKAADPDGLVLGPNQVNYKASLRWWTAAFANAGGLDTLDGFSTHAYNCTLGSIASARANIKDLVDWLEGRGFTKDRWQTEQGADTVYGNAYSPRPMARWWFLKVIASEILGLCPIERYVSWYDAEHGFSQVAHWTVSKNGCEPFLPMIRNAIAEIGDRTIVESFDFGKADVMYLGGRWRGNDGSETVMVLAQSHATQPVHFRVTGATSLERVDPFGNVSTLPTSGNLATVVPYEFPTWIRVPAGVTVDFIESDWQFGNQITATSSTSSSSAALRLNLLANGVTEDEYTRGSLPFTDSSAKFPQILTINVTPSTVDRVIVYGVYDINQFTAFTDFDVDVTVDGSTWKRVARVQPGPKRSYLYTTDMFSSNALLVSFWKAPYCWDFKMPGGPLAGVRAARITVRAVSYAMFEKPELVTAVWGETGYETWWRQVYIRDVIILGPPATRPKTAVEKRRQRRRVTIRR